MEQPQDKPEQQPPPPLRASVRHRLQRRPFVARVEVEQRVERRGAALGGEVGADGGGGLPRRLQPVAGAHHQAA